MSFDEAQYVQDFIKKLRGARTLPEDLLPRYAVTLPAPEAEIAARVKAVRAYWNKSYQGKSTAAQVARMCRAEDERLRARHGAAMETRAWWEQRQSEHQSAARAQITNMAEDLRQRFGQLGVVTHGVAESYAAKLDLTGAESAQAVQQAGLTMVEAVALPETEPIKNFTALVKAMSECAASSVPELVHPGAGEFSLVDRYTCRSDPTKRLDVAALDRQVADADKRGVSATEDARRAALKILRHALKSGVDLRDLALYHLVTVAHERDGTSPRIVAEGLRKTGLSQQDAAVIAVVLAEQTSAAGTAGLGKVRSLLADGRLAEAAQAAQGLAEEAGRTEALQEVAEARNQLSALLSEAKDAHESRDDARAVAALRKAALISVEDAEAALAAIPLAPPAGLRAVCEGSSVRLFWEHGPGHEETATYIVSRTEQRPPAAPEDGLVVHPESVTSCTDGQAPVARILHYGVFAVAKGRPSSAPAVTAVTLLPPVSQLAAEVGPASISLSWSAHPAVRDVRVVRAAPGRPPVAVPATGGSCHLENLAEGQTQQFEVTAIYHGLDGAELRSPAQHLEATPRSQARPITKFRARPVEIGGAARIRVSWTPVDSSEVQVRRAGAAPAWKVGAQVSAQEMASYGQEITARRVQGRTEVSLEADVPTGVHHLVPFSIGGTGIVVGAQVAVGVTEPVRQLVVTPFATHATVSWEWPPGAQLAEVSWMIGHDTDSVVIGQAQYRSDGGARVPLGPTPCTVDVRALILAGETSFTSPAVRAVIDNVVDIAIAYKVSGLPGVGPFGGRSKKIVFTSAEGCDNVQVRLVASTGRVMPTSAAGGIPLLDTTLTLEPDRPAEHHVSVPRSVKRPYWVRCFVMAGRARLIDPPISALKEA
jgi:hypothetical protein